DPSKRHLVAIIGPRPQQTTHLSGGSHTATERAVDGRGVRLLGRRLTGPQQRRRRLGQGLAGAVMTWPDVAVAAAGVRVTHPVDEHRVERLQAGAAELAAEALQSAIEGTLLAAAQE